MPLRITTRRNNNTLSPTSRCIYRSPRPIVIDEGNYWPAIHNTVQAGFVRDGHPVRIGLRCGICDDHVLAFPPGALHNPDNQPTDNVTVLPCGHFYGATCIAKWRSTQGRNRQTPTCPSCRYPLVHRACGHPVSLLKTPFTTMPLGGADSGVTILSLPTHLPPALLRVMSKNNSNSNNDDGNRNQPEEDKYCPSCRRKQVSDRRAAVSRNRPVRIATAISASARRAIINNNNDIANRRRQRVAAANQPASNRPLPSPDQQQVIIRALRDQMRLHNEFSQQQRNLLQYLMHQYNTEPQNGARFLEIMRRWPLQLSQQQQRQQQQRRAA